MKLGGNRMNGKLKWFGAALVISCMALVTGCGDGDKKAGGSEEESVAVVLKTLSSPYWKYVEAGAKAAGKDLGITVSVVGPSVESEVIQQVNMLEDQIN